MTLGCFILRVKKNDSEFQTNFFNAHKNYICKWFKHKICKIPKSSNNIVHCNIQHLIIAYLIIRKKKRFKACSCFFFFQDMSKGEQFTP